MNHIVKALEQKIQEIQTQLETGFTAAKVTVGVKLMKRRLHGQLQGLNLAKELIEQDLNYKIEQECARVKASGEPEQLLFIKMMPQPVLHEDHQSWEGEANQYWEESKYGCLHVVRTMTQDNQEGQGSVNLFEPDEMDAAYSLCVEDRAKDQVYASTDLTIPELKAIHRMIGQTLTNHERRQIPKSEPVPGPHVMVSSPRLRGDFFTDQYMDSAEKFMQPTVQGKAVLEKLGMVSDRPQPIKDELISHLGQADAAGWLSGQDLNPLAMDQKDAREGELPSKLPDGLSESVAIRPMLTQDDKDRALPRLLEDYPDAIMAEVIRAFSSWEDWQQRRFRVDASEVLTHDRLYLMWPGGEVYTFGLNFFLNWDGYKMGRLFAGENVWADNARYEFAKRVVDINQEAGAVTLNDLSLDIIRHPDGSTEILTGGHPLDSGLLGRPEDGPSFYCINCGDQPLAGRDSSADCADCERCTDCGCVCGDAL